MVAMGGAESECFNTQPRGGGCLRAVFLEVKNDCFNTQPRGGGCPSVVKSAVVAVKVSTHSRAEAAAIAKVRIEFDSKLFQHTAARRRLPHLLISQGF